MKKVLLLALFLCLAVPAYAAVDWDEGFEYANNQAFIGAWSSNCNTSPFGAGTMDVSTTRAHGGSKSIKLTYPPPDSENGCFADRFTTGSLLSDTLYTRYWIFLDNFKPHSVGTKIAFHGQNGAYPSFWWGMIGGTHLDITLQAITLADGSKTNLNITGGSIPVGAWACVETQITMSSPGGADGIIRSWVNDVAQINITNQRMRPTSDQPDLRKANAKMNFVRMYRQHGVGLNNDTGYIYYDDYAISRDARIGCGATPPPVPDTTPPTMPGSFSASAVNGSSVSMSWTASTDANLAGYQIKRCAGSCTPTATIYTVGASATTTQDNTASPNTQYTYAIRGYDVAGNLSTQTANQTVTTPAVFLATLATDTFVRSDNADLGAAWDAGYTARNALKITSNRVRATAISTVSQETYNAITTPDDQWASIVIRQNTFGVNKTQCVLLRAANAPTATMYAGCVAHDTDVTAYVIRETTAGTSATLSTSADVTHPQVGDTLHFEAQGTALRLYRIRAGVKTLLTSTTDATLTSGKAGILNFAYEGTDLSVSEVSDFAVGGFSSGTAATAPTFDASSYSTTTNTNTVSWNHTVGTGTDRVLTGCAYSRDTIQADGVVTSFTANGIPLTKLDAQHVADIATQLNVEQWYLANPSSGVQNMTITWAGALSQYGAGAAQSLSGVDQTDPIDAQSTGSSGSTTAISDSITTATDHAAITSCVFAKSPVVEVAVGQVADVNLVVALGLNDTLMISSLRDKTPAGVRAMAATQTGDPDYYWAAVTSSFTPATVTPVVEPTIESFSVNQANTAITLGFGATTPTAVILQEFTNSGSFSLSTTYPISAFTAGVMSYTFRNGLSGACVVAVNSLGVPNSLPAAYKCISLATVVGAEDTTPIVLTQTAPGGSLNSGTTTTTFVVSLDKPANSVRWALTNIAYSAMTNEMTCAALECSASTGAILTDSSTTHIYVQSMFENSLLDEIESTVALDVTITVLGTAVDTTPPGDITDLTCAAGGQAQVTCSWPAASGGDVQGYQVYLGTAGACADYVPAGSPITTTTTILNLTPNSQVSIVVKAIDTSQNFSANYSNCQTLTTSPIADVIPPAQMTGLAGQAFVGSVLLTWVGLTNDVASPTIEISPAGCASFTTIASGLFVNFLSVNLAAATEYCFRGFWVDLAGNPGQASEAISVTTLSSGTDGPRPQVPFGVTRDPATRGAAGSRATRQ